MVAVAFRYPSPTPRKKMMMMMMMISCTPLFFPIIFFSFTHPKPYHPFETLNTWLEKKKVKKTACITQTPKCCSAAKAKKNRRSEARSQNCAMEKEAPKTGTTIVACEYADGIVIGADTRVSTGTFCVGIFVNNFAFRFSFVPLFVASRSHRSSLSRDDNNNNRDVHFQSRVG